MIKDEIYDYYIDYLFNKLKEERISKGALKLMKISDEMFVNFKYEFSKNENFRNKVINISKMKKRDRLINLILNEKNSNSKY